MVQNAATDQDITSNLKQYFCKAFHTLSALNVVYYRNTANDYCENKLYAKDILYSNTVSSRVEMTVERSYGANRHITHQTIH